jgi:hypothetical protein|tara:strand:+ start:932 stop:1411 length:480 start_codon:yes stop_codon:yes gene_type:complete
VKGESKLGADIHSFYIAKCRGTEKWFAFEPGNDDRVYAWFGIIAGVRGEPHFDAKGLPEIDCEAIKPLVEDRYYHSATHLTLEEVREANREKARHDNARGYGTDEYYQRIPEPDDIMERIYATAEYNSSFTPWAGTLQQFIGKENSIEDCVMYVCAFDS